MLGGHHFSISLATNIEDGAGGLMSNLLNKNWIIPTSSMESHHAHNPLGIYF